MQYHQNNVALGSEIALNIVTSQANQTGVEALFRELWKKIFRFERQFSRFLPGSELSLFNRNAGPKQFITPEFRNILVAAQRISRETAGLYNPFILPALQAAGYYHSLVKGHEKDLQDNHSGKSVVSVDHLEIGQDWARIPYGTALDLGGCGKGYLADQLANSIKHRVTGYWLSLGGDIAVGGEDDAGKPWEITIQKATISGDQNIGRVILPSRRQSAVATSGVTARYGINNGKAWHHLIDPRTLAPATTDVRLVTVCADSAFRADVLASCAAIIGSDNASTFLKQCGIKTALLQCETPKGAGFNIRLGKIHSYRRPDRRAL